MFLETENDFSHRVFGDCLGNKALLPIESLLKLSGNRDLANPEYKTGLTTKVAKAWGTPINELLCAQVRILVGQKLGLEWLAKPVAIFVSLYPQALCTFYPGDLTLAALRAHRELFEIAPIEIKAMLCGDFSWMDEAYAFDEHSTEPAEAKGLLMAAQKQAGLLH